jgi:uncharacterized delta-60 repeat protein
MVLLIVPLSLDGLSGMKKTRFFSVSLLLFLCVANASLNAQQILDGEADPGFSAPPFFNEIGVIDVRKTYVDPDNKIYIAGNFDRIDDSIRKGFARLNADGSLDDSFNPSIVGGDVLAIETLSNGKILIGGDFTGVNGRPLSNIARLNANGTVDSTFNVQVNEVVRVIVQRANGKVLLGGKFTQVNGTSVSYLAQLNTSDQLDPGFTYNLFFVNPFPQTRTGVHTIVEKVEAVSSDNSIYVGGRFELTENGETEGVIRLTNSGAIDASFNKNFELVSSTIFNIAIDSDENIVFVGFARISQNDVILDYDLGRASSAGVLDTSFRQANLFDRVQGFDDVDVLNTGQILLSGSFGLLFVNADGSLPENGAPIGSGDAFSTSLQSGSGGSQTIVTGGRIAFVDQNASGGVVQKLVRLTETGSLLFTPDFDFLLASADIRAIASDARGNVYVAGNFIEVGSLPRDDLVKLNPDGSVDEDWVVEQNGSVHSINILRDGNTLIAGGFGSVNGISKPSWAKLNPDGTVISDFPAVDPNDPNFNQFEKVIELSSGKFLASGSFYPDGLNGDRKFLARFNADGTYDDTFDPAFGNFVYDFDIARSGDIYVVGAFDLVTGNAVPGVAKLSSAGVVDTSFIITVEDQIETNYPYLVRALSDGTVLIGGSFYTVNSEARRFLAKLNSDGTLTDFTVDLYRVLVTSPTGLVLPLMETIVELPSGKIVIAGNLQTVDQDYQFLQRLNPDGTIDTDFFDGELDGIVTAANIDSRGNLLLGGNFSKLGLVSTGQVLRAAIGLDLSSLCVAIPTRLGTVVTICL